MMTTYRESINRDVFMVHSFALNDDDGDLKAISSPSAEFLYKTVFPNH